MGLAHLYRVVQDLEGNVVTGVLGTVLVSGTSTLATLYPDASGITTLPNPTTNNAQFGSFNLYLEAGLYDIQFVKAGYTFETQYRIECDDPEAGVAQILGTANRILVSPASGLGFVTLSTPQDIAPDSYVQFAHLGLGTPATEYALTVSGNSSFSGGSIAASDVTITGGSIALTETLEVGGATGLYGSVGIGGAPPAPSGHLGVAGVVGLGGIAPVGTIGLYLLHIKASRYGMMLKASGADVGNEGIVFQNMAGTFVGNINYSATVTSYNTTSDARLKHDVANLTGELALIQALRPVSFRWNVDESIGHGFLAQDVAALVAGVVSGEEDAVDEGGGIVPQMIDYSKLVPWLVGAIKTLAQRLDVVEDAAGI